MRIHIKKGRKEIGKERPFLPLGSKSETDHFEYLCLEDSHHAVEIVHASRCFFKVREWKPSKEEKAIFFSSQEKFAFDAIIFISTINLPTLFYHLPF